MFQYYSYGPILFSSIYLVFVSCFIYYFILFYLKNKKTSNQKERKKKNKSNQRSQISKAKSEAASSFQNLGILSVIWIMGLLFLRALLVKITNGTLPDCSPLLLLLNESYYCRSVEPQIYITDYYVRLLHLRQTQWGASQEVSYVVILFILFIYLALTFF